MNEDKRIENIEFAWSLSDIKEMEEVSKQFGFNFSLDNTVELKLTYNFAIEYFGSIVKNFEYLIKIMESGKVIKVNMENVEGGQILCKKLFDTYQKLYDGIKNANPIS